MNAPDPNFMAWWITIGIGVVVAVCVVILLSLLRSFVTDIDKNVDVVARGLLHVSGNLTGTPTNLQQTAGLVAALGEELAAHERALS